MNNNNEVKTYQKTMNIVNRIRSNKLTPKNVYNTLAPEHKSTNKVNTVKKGKNNNEWILQIRPKSKLVKILKAPASMPLWYLKSNDTAKGSKTAQYLSNAKYDPKTYNPLVIKAFEKAANAVNKIGKAYLSHKRKDKPQKPEVKPKPEMRGPTKVKVGKGKGKVPKLLKKRAVIPKVPKN